MAKINADAIPSLALPGILNVMMDYIVASGCDHNHTLDQPFRGRMATAVPEHSGDLVRLWSSNCF
jgi:hypothetical protein